MVNESRFLKMMSMFNKVKQVLDCTVLYVLYCSLALSYISYCDDIRGNNLNMIPNVLFFSSKKISLNYLL